MINIGGNIGELYVGSTPIEKAYIGSQLVWEKSAPMLPYDAEVEYLCAPGAQYINTGIKGSSNIRIRLKCLYPASSNSTSKGWIFGSRVANNNKAYNVFHSYNATWRYGNKASGSWINNTERVLIFDNTASANSMKVYTTSDSLVTTLTVTASTFNNNLDLYLFGCNQNGSVITSNSGCTIYSCIIYQNTSKIAEFIPVRKNGVGYMYDKVSGTLFGNQGSGSFTYGPDVT